MTTMMMEPEVREQLDSVEQTMTAILNSLPETSCTKPLHDSIAMVLRHLDSLPDPANEVLHDLDVAMAMASDASETLVWKQLLRSQADLRRALIPSLNPKATRVGVFALREG